MGFSFYPFSAAGFSAQGSGTNTGLILAYSSVALIDGVHPYGSIVNDLIDGNFSSPQLFFGPSDTFLFDANAEYTLSLSVVCVKKSLNFQEKMEIYMVGDSFPTSNPLGELIATYICPNTVIYQPFAQTDWNFDVKVDGTGYLRFVVYGGDWSVSNISLQPASEFGFTPDAVRLMIPVEGYQNTHLQFSVQMFDINNNLVLI